MDPAQKRRGRFGIQARVLSLAVLFTLFTAGIIIISSARSLAQQLRRSTIQSAEYTLQAAGAGIRQDIQEVDELSLWCCVDSTVRTAMLTDISTGVLTHTVYPIIANKYNSMHTAPYIQRFLLASKNGRIIMMGTAASQSRAVGQEALGLLPGMAEGEPMARWESIQKDPLMQSGIVVEGIPITQRMVRGPSQYAASVYLSVSPAHCAPLPPRTAPGCAGSWAVPSIGCREAASCRWAGPESCWKASPGTRIPSTRAPRCTMPALKATTVPRWSARWGCMSCTWGWCCPKAGCRPPCIFCAVRPSSASRWCW